MKTKLVFVDGKEIELEVSERSPLAIGLVWSVHLDIPRPKNEFTVIGVHWENGERFADFVYADTWQEAEQESKERHGSGAMIAAVLVGHIECVDEQ